MHVKENFARRSGLFHFRGKGVKEEEDSVT
jgi:hypothetical protein